MFLYNSLAAVPIYMIGRGKQAGADRVVSRRT